MKKLQKQKSKTFTSSTLILYLALLLTLVFTGVKGNFYNSAFADTAPPKEAFGQSKLLPNLTKNTAVTTKAAENLKKPEKIDFKYSLIKFYWAMLGVFVSALAIFLGLKVYQKLILKNGSFSSSANNFDYENSLDSPKDFKEAINLFLHKTDK